MVAPVVVDGCRGPAELSDRLTNIMKKRYERCEIRLCFTQLVKGGVDEACTPAGVRDRPTMVESGKARKSIIGRSVVLFHVFGWAKSTCVK